MSYHQTGAAVPEDSVCQYGASKLRFRGPSRALDGSYLACIGGDETFGRFVERPYAAILEGLLDSKCVNFGSLLCGVEALCGDSTLVELANASDLCVLQLPGALGQSNRFYRVHPRRNDRFLSPTPDLLTLYPEVDFTDVHFVRHLLGLLHSYSDARFEIVVHELRKKWVETLGTFLQAIRPPVVLLNLQVDGEIAHEVAGPLGCEPVYVDTEMLEALRPHSADVVSMSVRISGESDELEDMLFGTLQQPMAEHMIGPATHRRIAETLSRSIRDLH